jgi:hypothetical protein
MPWRGIEKSAFMQAWMSISASRSECKSYKKLWKDAAKFAAMPHERIACPFSG